MSSVREPLYGQAADRIRDQLREPSDLDVAISVAQQLLDSDSVLSLREALRLLLRALGAEPGDEPPRTTPDTLPKAVTQLLAAIAEALTVPLPSIEPADESAYYKLLDQRATAVRIHLETMLDFPDVDITRDASELRARTALLPVEYALYEPEATKAGEGK